MPRAGDAGPGYYLPAQRAESLPVLAFVQCSKNQGEPKILTSEPPLSEAPVIVGNGELASYLDVTTGAIGDLAAKQRVVRVGRGKYDLKASIRAYVRHLIEAAAGRPSVKQDLNAEKTRLTKAQADGKELENSVREGRLADVAVFESRWADDMVKLRARLLSLPGSIGLALPHLTQHELATIDRCLRDTMQVLADGDL